MRFPYGTDFTKPNSDNDAPSTCSNPGEDGQSPREIMTNEAANTSSSIPLTTSTLAIRRDVSKMVSVITPTYNRDRFLKRALKYFRSQTYSNIEWIILDDSPRPSESFRDISDSNIHYRHIDGKISVGEKRNILIERSVGEIIIQFDDDDYYSPDYVSMMVSALIERDADIVNLRGWFLYDIRSRFFGYWDLMQKNGLHYVCDQADVTLEIFGPENSQSLENNHFGYGFSYAFKREVWHSVKFPTIDWNEDAEFYLRAGLKFKVDGLYDTAGICLHTLHSDSTSRCFPQYQIPNFLFPTLFPTVDFLSLENKIEMIVPEITAQPDRKLSAD